MTTELTGYIDIFVNENPEGNRPHMRGFVKINGVKAEFAAWPNKNGKPGVYDGKITPPREQQGGQQTYQPNQAPTNTGYTTATPVDDAW